MSQKYSAVTPPPNSNKCTILSDSTNSISLLRQQPQPSSLQLQNEAKKRRHDGKGIRKRRKLKKVQADTNTTFERPATKRAVTTTPQPPSKTFERDDEGSGATLQPIFEKENQISLDFEWTYNVGESTHPQSYGTRPQTSGSTTVITTTTPLWTTTDFSFGPPLGRGKFGCVYRAKGGGSELKPYALKVSF